jgi:hypothetical protein
MAIAGQQQPDILLHLAIQGLSFFMYSESKPSYQLMKVGVKNLFIRDYNSPNKALPYFIQTIILPDSVN